MLQAMAHRGPDGDGLWVSPSGQCVLGHRRLAILDLSDSATQPMATRDDAFVLSYNGECYNFASLRRELEHRGESLHSTGDTEVVLKLIASEGTTSLLKLNGMFALAFWDEHAGRLLLARDRFGQKPLYWARFEDGIIFASEVRALLASGLVPRNISRQGVLGFLAHGAVQGPDTIVENVWLLPRASSLSMRTGETPQVGQYWRPSHEQRPLSSADLRESFLKAIRRHLVSDVPVGVFLSGGIDSSIIAAAACHEAGPGVTSLTVVFPDQRAQCEAEYARRAARQAGTRHVEVPVGDREMLDLVNEAVSCLDQPSIDGVNTFIVSRAARRADLRVALSGLGGDELFGGYSTFQDVPRVARLMRWGGLIKPFEHAVGRWGSWDRRWSKVAEMLAAPPGLIQAYMNRRRLFCSQHLRALMPQWCDGRWQSGVSEWRDEELIASIQDQHPLDAITRLELDVYMGQTLLRDTDVMGMANSLEIRVPFLDADFSELALSLPSEARTRRPGAKWLLIEAFRDWLPRENWDRPKQGFALPWQDWMLGELRSRIAAGLDVLTDCIEPFAADAVRHLWSEFQRNPAKVGWSRPWSLFVLGDYVARHQLVSREQETKELRAA